MYPPLSCQCSSMNPGPQISHLKSWACTHAFALSVPVTAEPKMSSEPHTDTCSLHPQDLSPSLLL